MAKKTNSDLLALRKKSGLNQSEFWGPLGVTQSGGSRYENGRVPPKPVRMLILLRYLNGTLEQLLAGDLVKRV